VKLDLAPQRKKTEDVLRNSVQRISEPERKVLNGKIHHEELHNLYSSPNIIWAIRLSRIRWAERLAHM